MFVLLALVAAALEWLPVPLAVLVTKPLSEPEAALVVAALPGAVPESVVTPTDSTDAVGTPVLEVFDPFWPLEVDEAVAAVPVAVAVAVAGVVAVAVVTNVSCPFAPVDTSLLEPPKVKPVICASVVAPLRARIS